MAQEVEMLVNHIPEMSSSIATVQFLSGKVYVLLAVFEFVKNDENVFAMFLRASIQARKVFTPVAKVFVLLSVGIFCHSTDISQAAERDKVVSAFPTSMLPVTDTSQYTFVDVSSFNGIIIRLRVH